MSKPKESDDPRPISPDKDPSKDRVPSQIPIDGIPVPPTEPPPVPIQDPPSPAEHPPIDENPNKPKQIV